METTELYYPQIAAAVDAYSFTQGIEIEIYSAQNAYCDWAKLRFTEQYRPKLQLERRAPASIRLGYNRVLDEVFTGFVARRYDSGARSSCESGGQKVPEGIGLCDHLSDRRSG